jgi:hypothetical protein
MNLERILQVANARVDELQDAIAVRDVIEAAFHADRLAGEAAQRQAEADKRAAAAGAKVAELETRLVVLQHEYDAMVENESARLRAAQEETAQRLSALEQEYAAKASRLQADHAAATLFAAQQTDEQLQKIAELEVRREAAQQALDALKRA